MRLSLLALTLCLVLPARAFAEWQIRPFLGVSFGGGTTLIDPEQAAGHPNLSFGFNGVLLGEVIGVEADVGYAPGFFQTGKGDQGLVLRSGAATVTGNIVVALPRHLAQYTLRPYLVGGGGLMHAHIENRLSSDLRLAETLRAIDVGGGVTGFLTNRIGVSWDVRYFRSIGSKPENGFSIGPEQLSFWRANMALAIRF